MSDNENVSAAAVTVATVTEVATKPSVDLASIAATLTANASIKSGTVASSASAKAGVVATKEEVKVVKEVKQVNTVGTGYSKELNGLFDRIAATKNQVAINVIDQIKQYVIDMGPSKPMSSDEGARHQVKLFRAIRTIIDYTGNDFQITFATLLRMFDELESTVFSDRYVFRFMDSVVLNSDERRAFERILNLIKVSASVVGRKEAVRQLNFQKALQYVFTDEGKGRVLSFFNK